MKSLALSLLLLFFAEPVWAETAALPIHPVATITVATTSSASSAQALPIGSLPSWQVELQNTGSVIAFCAFGGSTIAATTSGYPVQPGVDKVITVDQDAKYISCITASSTTTVYASGGVGN